MLEPFYLGIEIGGTKLQLGIGRGDGRLIALERKVIHPPDGAAGILRQIQVAYDALQDLLAIGRGVVAVGVGYGGPVDATSGRVIKSYQIKGWDDFPLADWLVENLEIPIAVIQNDADTAGLAEARFGAGKGCSPILYVTIGSGIGGALIIDGRIYRGAGRGAAEIGHLNVLVNSTEGPPRVCELESIASGWGIGAEAQAIGRILVQEGQTNWVALKAADGDPGRITALIIAEAAAQGDVRASRVLGQAREAIAFALTQAIALFAPRRIILGGGVSLIGETGWYEPIRQLVDRDVFEPFRGGYDILPPGLVEEVVVHGAIALAHDAHAESG